MSDYRVLMIDDESEILDCFEDVFESYDNITFHRASKGSEGVDLAKNHKPQVVLVDLGMPEMSGEQVIEAIAGDLPDTKFIVMTGLSTVEIEERLHSNDKLEAYYQKPVDLIAVVEKVISLLYE